MKIPFTNNEIIALASFIYNIGVYAFKSSTMYKKLKAEDKKGAAEEFERWIYDDKKQIQQGLINRRKREKELFLTPDQ